MRVISGSARGLKLIAPEGMGTRPTTDRVKESLFNIIQPYIPAQNILDLFGGSGALGIEALSRGSKACVFVDNDKKAVDIITFNTRKARVIDRANIVKTDAFSYLSACSEKFDIIFLDPPYNKGFLKDVLKEIYKRRLLKDGGIIAVEGEAGGESAEDCGFVCIKVAKYGKTTVSRFKHSQDGDNYENCCISGKL